MPQHPKLIAIYHRVTTDEEVKEKHTLVYAPSDGFTWFRPAGNYTNHQWHGKFPTAVLAEEAARKMGFDPQQIYYTR